MPLSEFAKQRYGKVKDFLLLIGETTPNECQEYRQMARIFDITTETKPVGVSTWTVPEDSGNFCTAGGRFGTHSSNENFTPVYYQPRGVRGAFQRRRARGRYPRSVRSRRRSAITSPPSPTKPTSAARGRAPNQHCKVAIQTNNVEVDDRGYIYAVDRANTGMHILELTGSARQAADFSKAER